ncbi:MAG: RIP metalloprotease RseP [Candidatus Neomarinimicrobiota bacterium]
MMTIVAVLIVIGGVVIAHELGHFIFAKLTGMRVEAFSIGFPPKIISKKIGETDYRISAIPLGGYVKVSGVIDESLDVGGAESNEPWTFAAKKTWQKLLFISGGVIFNVIFSIIIFSILTMRAGIYEPDNQPVVESVIPGFPADSLGIKAGDTILAVDGTAIDSWENMTKLIHNHPHDSIAVKWQTAGIIQEKKLMPVANKVLQGSKLVEVGLVGISPVMHHRSARFFESIDSGLKNTWYWLKITVISLKMLATGEESLKNIGGPIFIAKLAGESAKSGISSILGLMAIISVNLALINILPVPAFDGGHIIIILIEAILRRPLSLNAKVRIQQVGLALIILLTVLVLFNDIARVFKW